MKRPLGTAKGRMEAAPLLLLDMEMAEGVAGCAYLFCYQGMAAAPLAHMAEAAFALIESQARTPQEAADAAAAGFTLLGNHGLAAMALAGLDMAFWDAAAKDAGMALAKLLGAAPDPVPAYNSNGLSLMDPSKLGDEAKALLDEGFRAVKLRLGYASGDADLAAVRAVTKAVPDGALIMTDYNQALDPGDAMARGRLLDTEKLTWIEEPVAHDDLVGCARVADAVATPIQIGENFRGAREMETALSLGACDLVMPDLQRIGGVTGWRKAATLAADAQIPMSSHLFPEVSVHMLAATPTRHWLEYVDWARPVLAEPLEIRDGMAQVPDRPGSGIAWDEAAVKRFAAG